MTQQQSRRHAPTLRILEEGQLALHTGDHKLVFGSEQPDFIKTAVSSLKALIDDPQQINAALAFIHSSEPQNEGEALLAMHAYTAHSLALTSAGFAQRSKHTQAFEAYTRQFGKLSDVMVRSMEALRKLQGNGGQKIVVQHVHVNDGGQAAFVARGED